MTTRGVRSVLIVVALLFLFGISWAIITIARRANNTTVEQPTDSEPVAGQPEPTEDDGQPKPSNDTEVESAKPKPSLAQTRPARKFYYVTEEYIVTETFESEAWASASASASSSDGSANADAHAE